MSRPEAPAPSYNLERTIAQLRAEPGVRKHVQIPVSDVVLAAFKPPLEDALARQAKAAGVQYWPSWQNGGQVLHLTGAGDQVLGLVQRLDAALNQETSIEARVPARNRVRAEVASVLMDMKREASAFGCTADVMPLYREHLFLVQLTGPLASVTELTARTSRRLGMGMGGISTAPDLGTG